MPGLCGDMKFRQRVAWLGVLLYIAATAFFFYYLFEISDTFNAYALDHIHHYHTKVGTLSPAINKLLKGISYLNL